MPAGQHVCLLCGYNMIGPAIDACPFCAAGRAEMITAEACAARFAVESTPVAAGISRMKSVPALGYEHAAYRVESATRAFWIDCPASFDGGLARADVIAFTHSDFLGAVNLYRETFSAEAWIHRLEAERPLARPFPFDRLFEGDFCEDGLEAVCVGGHSPGFTVYMTAGVLFVGDLLYLTKGRLHFNPYGPKGPTRAAGRKLHALIEGRTFTHVCDVNEALPYGDWKDRFDRLMARIEAA